MVQLDGNQNPQPATVALYSAAQISLKEVQGINPVDFCHRIMLSHAFKNKKKQYLS